RAAVAATAIYTLSYTTLFRSGRKVGLRLRVEIGLDASEHGDGCTRPGKTRRGLFRVTQGHPRRPADQRCGAVDGRVVERGPVLTGDLDEILESWIRDQGHPGPLFLEEGIGGDGGPVQEDIVG